MKVFAVVLLVLLLLPLAATFGQGGDTIVVTLPDATNNPLCGGTLTVDCISSVEIFAVGVAQPVAIVPASAFTVSGGQATAIIPVPAAPGRRYGNIQYFARTNAIAFDGSTIESLDGATVGVVRRPPPASLAAN